MTGKTTADIKCGAGIGRSRLQKTIKEYAGIFGSELLGLIYPPDIYCICCKAVIKAEPYALCQSCMRDIEWVGDKTCRKCGKILQRWNNMSVCMDCKSADHNFDRGFTCACYDDKTRRIIHDLKYGGKGYIGKNIGRMMYDRLKLEGLDYDILIPVPMHEKKQKKRGFNQAELMARELSKLSEITFRSDILIRRKQTKTMAHLSAGDRRVNMMQAFYAAKPDEIKDRRILLVDDVYTTGSTSDGCAGCLKAAGAGKVDIITFAAGQNTFKNQSQAG